MGIPNAAFDSVNTLNTVKRDIKAGKSFADERRQLEELLAGLDRAS